MKQIYKTICLAAAGMFALSANAQIFFTEDFEGTMDGTTGMIQLHGPVEIVESSTKTYHGIFKIIFSSVSGTMQKKKSFLG